MNPCRLGEPFLGEESQGFFFFYDVKIITCTHCEATSVLEPISAIMLDTIFIYSASSN
jgi:hypothetical protein